MNESAFDSIDLDAPLLRAEGIATHIPRLTGDHVLDVRPPGREEHVSRVALAATVPQPCAPADALLLVDWLRPALDLPLLEISVDVTLRRRIQLSSPACTVVRGLLGKRLRDLRCRTGATTCAGCPETARCDYARTIEAGSPHPFWLQGVPATPTVDSGVKLTSRLYLASPAHEMAPYLEVALRDALRALDAEAALSPSRIRHEPLGQLVPAEPPGGPLRLRAETPICLRGDGAICRRLCPRMPWLALLVRAGVRRLDALVRAFAPPPGGRLPRAELPDLSKVDLLGGTLAPWSSSRFSHRQHKRLPLRGLAGDAILHGDHLRALVPLLRVLAVTGVGKATSLGFGVVHMVPP